MGEVKRRWRDYRTPSGGRPVRRFLTDLPDEDQAAILDGMREVRDRGLRAGGARQLDGRIWEVRVSAGDASYRILFASVANRGRILLSLEGFSKKTQKTPPAKIKLAKKRLADWETR